MISELYRNTAFESSEGALIRLHEAMMEDDDSPEADRLRDELDLLDADLTAAQRAYLRGLSGDLYQLEDEEVFLSVESEDRLAEGFERAVQRALLGGDFGRLLHLIRTDESPYDDERRAYLRGLAYAGLGRHAPAFRFMRRAARSGKLVHEYLMLDYLIHLDASQAAGVGRGIVDSPDAPDAMRVQAAWAIVLPTREMPDKLAFETWEWAVRYLPALVEGERSRSLPRSVLALGLLTLALCHELLGNSSTAVRYYLEGFFVDPGNSSVVDALRAHLPDDQLASIIGKVEPVVERSGLAFVEQENARIFQMAA